MSHKRNVLTGQRAALLSFGERSRWVRRQASVGQPVRRGQRAGPRLLGALWDALRLSY